MPDTSNSDSAIRRRIAWITGLACAACCAVPLIGFALGASALAGLAAYAEKAVIAIAAIGLLIFISWRLTRKTAPACDVNGPCNPAKSNHKPPVDG